MEGKNLDTFNFLCTELWPYIEHETTCLREPISVEKRVAVTVWKLATNVEYRTLSNLFGIGRSTVASIIAETCRAVSEKLMKRFVTVPDGDQLKEVVKGFESVWGFSQVAGAIDGSHLPIFKPQESPSDYYN